MNWNLLLLKLNMVKNSVTFVKSDIFRVFSVLLIVDYQYIPLKFVTLASLVIFSSLVLSLR